METHERLEQDAAERGVPRMVERRRELRDPVVGSLYLIDNINGQVVRCRCLDASRHGLRLRLPLGYGVRAGRRYELCSHRPGQSQPPGLGLLVSRRATVTRTRIIVGEHGDDELEVGVRLDPSRAALVTPQTRPATEPATLA